MKKAYPGIIAKNTKVRVEDGSPFAKVKIVTATDDGKTFFVPGGLMPQVPDLVRTLTSDITELYEKQPELNQLTNTVDKEEILKISDLRNKKDRAGVSWLFISINGKEGWIEESKLTKISAYDWKTFGFEVLKDNADDFLYEPKAPSKFLTKLCSFIDKNNDQYLTTAELQAAFRDPATAPKLSRLVCYHSSEWQWGERSGEFKAEIEKLFKEGIDKEEHEDKKQEYIRRKDEILNALELRMNDLCFWPEVTNVPAAAEQPKPKAVSGETGSVRLTPEDVEAIKAFSANLIVGVEETSKSVFSWFSSSKPAKKNIAPAPAPSSPAPPPKSLPKKEPGKPTPFPIGDPKVYHFHPIAFVEQMRRLEINYCKIDENFFFTEYDQAFPETPLNALKRTKISRIFSSINEYYISQRRCCNIKFIAYMLATTKHETGHLFDPISEKGGVKYLEGMYDPVLGKDQNRRDLAIANGNTKKGDGVKYKGRGFVQLTWKTNYQKMQEKFGVDLLDNPDKAMDFELAVKIMVYGSEEGIFSGKKLGKYINERKTDYLNARRVINGLDKAAIVEGYAKKIEKCLKIEKCDF